MDSILKKGLFLVTVTGAITAFPIMAQAADIDDTQDMPTAGIEQVLGECYTSEDNFGKGLPCTDTKGRVFRYGIRQCTVISLYKK